MHWIFAYLPLYAVNGEPKKRLNLFIWWRILSDPGSMKFVYMLGHCPHDWRTMWNRNIVPTIFHTQNICHNALKTVRTTLQFIVVLPWQGEGYKK